VIFLLFQATTHIFTVNCPQITGGRQVQSACESRETCSTKRRF